MTTEENKIIQLWADTLIHIKESLPETDYNSWFTRISFGREENGSIVVNVPSRYVYDRFNSEYKELMENTISELGGSHYSISFEINKIAKSDSKSNSDNSNQKILTEKKIQEDTAAKKHEIPLNPDYTFDSFVPGDNSNFAYNACYAIAKSPGSTYNPCLIYGGVGLGKTHLIQSIANYILSNDPKAKVLYVTAENFTNEFIQSCSTEDRRKFKDKYRKAKVLLVDDIHFLQGKVGTQEELFNTFNDLYETGRQIVFTCDRPIEELKDMSDRIKSRFIRGLNIDLLPPDYETRVAILNKKCDEMNFIIGRDVISFIAENISSNVRALESCLTKLHAYSTLLHEDITLESAKEQLKHIIVSNKPETTGITIDQIIKTVSSYYNISPFEIKGKSRKQSVIQPRQIAMYLCRKLTDFSTTEIGAEFDGKNHTTVMYNVEKIESLMQSSESDVSSTVSKLSSQIQSDFKK